MQTNKPYETPPVAFMIFNRPDYTRAVFAEIRKAQPKKLFIIADGPRTPSEISLCEQTRAIVENIDWPCEVSKNYAERNLGLKERFRSGLNWFFDNVEAGIILEDDCLPHPSFFRFAGEMLEKYKSNERIMMISGDNFLPNFKTKESYLFSRYFCIWGWATWRRAWKLYDAEMPGWRFPESKKFVKNEYPDKPYMAHHIKEVFNEIISGKLKTWDVQWFYACLMSNGYSIVPSVNLISNIGVVGMHSSGGDVLNRPIYDIYKKPFIHPTFVIKNSEYDNEYYEKYFRPTPQPFHKWMRRELIAILVRYEIIKKIYRFVTGKKKQK